MNMLQCLANCLAHLVPRLLVVAFGLALLIGCSRDTTKSIRSPKNSVTTEGLADRPDQKSTSNQIDFRSSYRQSLTDAQKRNQRLLIYISGKDCAYCRYMEFETHRDRNVVDLASQFICVKIDIDDEPELQEHFRAYAIPKTFILSADGSPVAVCQGYVSAPEYLLWMQNGLDKMPTTWEQIFGDVPNPTSSPDDVLPAAVPPPVGAAQEVSDLVIWFVEQEMDTFNDPQWVRHEDLLSFLRSHGLLPRIEHFLRKDLMRVWEQAARNEQLPDMLISQSSSGFVGKLAREQELHEFVSMRLTQPDRQAQCGDFAGRGIWTVRSGRNATHALNAIDCLMQPRVDLDYCPDTLLAGESREEVVKVVSEVAKWWASGNVNALAGVWDECAPQKGCKMGCREFGFRSSSKVETREVQLWGNELFAVAIVELRATLNALHEPSRTIGTPSLVILRRNESRWRVLAVGGLNYDLNVVNEMTLFQFPFGQAAAAQRGDNTVGQGPQRNELPLTLFVDTTEYEKGWLGVTINVYRESSSPVPEQVAVHDGGRGTILWTVGTDGRMSSSEVLSKP